MMPGHNDLSDEEYEADLRTYLLHRLVRPEEMKFAEEWLRKYEASRTAASSAKRDAREEETLSIARRALSIAEDANSIAQSQSAAARRAARYAMYAAAIATAAAIVQAKDAILALIFTP